MSNNQEHLDNLSEIRSLMERSSSFISLSGLAGVSAGVIGVITSAMMYLKFSSFMEYSRGSYISSEKRGELIVYGIMISVVALIITFALVIFFTARKAKKNNLAVWDSSAKRLLVNLFIPLIAGGIFCLILVYHKFDWLVLPSMLIFYGLALINASKYTLTEIRWLGVIQITIGLLAAFFIGHSIIFWGIGFGVMNIVYGLVMYFRHER